MHYTLLELLIVLLVGSRPLHFGQGGQTGQQHIFHVFGSGDVFRPKVGLRTQDVLGLLFGQSCRGFQFIHLAYGQASTYGKGFVLGVGSLIEVEITVGVGSHDDIVSHLRSLDATGRALPGHHRGIGSHVTVQYLVPTDDAASAGVEETLGTLHAVALQAVFGSESASCPQAFLGDALLALGTILPTDTRCLIASDVDVPGGKYLYQLAQNILHELHGLLVADAEYVGEDTPVGTHLIRAARAAELRIGGKHGEGMTGQVYLRQHVNVAFCRIGHHLFHLFLSVVAAVVGVVILAAAQVAHHGTVAHRTYFIQLGIFLAFDAPALVVGQVPVEGIHVVQSQQVDVFLHELHGEEVPAHVEVHGAVGEARFIVHYGSGQQYALALGHGRQRLTQGLYAVENSLLGAPFYPDTFFRHGEAVAFLIIYGRVEYQRDGMFGGFAFRLFPDREGEVHGLCHILGEELCIAFQQCVACGVEHGSPAVQAEGSAFRGSHFARQGHYRVRSRFQRLCTACQGA